MWFTKKYKEEIKDLKALLEEARERRDEAIERETKTINKESEYKQTIDAQQETIRNANAKIAQLQKEIEVYKKYYKTNEAPTPAERAAVRAELEIEKLRSDISRNDATEVAKAYAMLIGSYQNQHYINSMLNSYNYHPTRLY